MENLHMIEAKFIDRKTIILSEDYPFKTQDIRLIIIPDKEKKMKRKAGLLKGKIRLANDFNEPLEDMKEYMEGIFFQIQMFCYGFILITNS